MDLYEDLYGRRCRSPIGWFEVGETGLIGPNLAHQAMEKVKVIQERMKMARSRQKFYTNSIGCIVASRTLFHDGSIFLMIFIKRYFFILFPNNFVKIWQEA